MPTASNIPSIITDAGNMRRDFVAERRDVAVVSRDANARTIDLSFSSEVEVERDGWVEILSHSPGAVDLSRLRDGGAVLESHDWNAQRGVIDDAWIDQADKRGRAVVRFSRTARGDELFTDVADGIKRHVSVGYTIQAATVAGERDDGTPVVLVTRWQPYEISFVAVPADTTVGVGRSVAPHPNQRKFPSMKNTRTRNTRTRDTGVIQDLRALIRDAMYAQPFHGHTPHGLHEPTAFISTPVRRSMLLPLQSTSLVGLFAADGSVIRTPAGALAGDSIMLDGAVIANSRVARAGANIIIRTDSSNAFKTGDTPATVALEQKPVRLVNVQPAPFGTVAEDADAPTSTLAGLVHAVHLVKKWGDSQTKAFSVELKRSDFQMVDSDETMAEIVQSATLGLSRAADACLLSAIAATNPASFTLAALASRGLRFDEVRALAGTNADGAAIGADGVLRIAGIAGELTPDMSGSVIGALDRVGVAINGDVTVLAERIGQNGAMRLSVWANMLPAIPDSSVVWKAAA